MACPSFIIEWEKKPLSLLSLSKQDTVIYHRTNSSWQKLKRLEGREVVSKQTAKTGNEKDDRVRAGETFAFPEFSRH